MVQISLQNSGGKAVFSGTLGHQREWKYLGHLSVYIHHLFKTVVRYWTNIMLDLGAVHLPRMPVLNSFLNE